MFASLQEVGIGSNSTKNNYESFKQSVQVQQTLDSLFLPLPKVPGLLGFSAAPKVLNKHENSSLTYGIAAGRVGGASWGLMDILGSATVFCGKDNQVLNEREFPYSLLQHTGVRMIIHKELFFLERVSWNLADIGRCQHTSKADLQI